MVTIGTAFFFSPHLGVQCRGRDVPCWRDPRDEPDESPKAAAGLQLTGVKRQNHHGLSGKKKNASSPTSPRTDMHAEGTDRFNREGAGWRRARDEQPHSLQLVPCAFFCRSDSLACQAFCFLSTLLCSAVACPLRVSVLLNSTAELMCQWHQQYSSWV